jgi:hypothetical protein
VNNWELVEGSAFQNIRTVNGHRTLLPTNNAEVILMHPRVLAATTKYDQETLKTMLKEKLVIQISLATKDDEVVQIAKGVIENVL